jgi:hypothetical protein
MLTVPVTTLGGGEHKVQGIGSSVKDWIAERASNMLLNKVGHSAFPSPALS